MEIVLERKRKKERYKKLFKNKKKKEDFEIFNFQYKKKNKLTLNNKVIYVYEISLIVLKVIYKYGFKEKPITS